MENREREVAKQLLDKYEKQADHWHRARNWLIFICVALVIACGVLCQNLYHKWQEERWARIFSEALAESYEQDIDHYQQLYYDCLNNEPSLPWEGYSGK